MTLPGLSVVIVTHHSRAFVWRLLERLVDELRDGDEVIVVDNASSDGTPEEVSRVAPEAVLLRNAENAGFAAAANVGAARARAEVLLFMNPDAVPEEGFGDAIRRPVVEGQAWDAWMGLVTTQGGRAVNTSGGIVHFTGISWAGQAGSPVEEAPRTPREVPFVSGACLAVRREAFERTGGFPRDYFLYFEDVDLSLRLRLAGGRLGLEPAARVDHAYEFEKGSYKWRLLERNRWATIVRTYPAPLLVLLVPALVATELALLAVAARGGWLREKALAWRATLATLPRLLRERRHVQATRRISAVAFASYLTPELSSPYLGWAARSTTLRTAMRAYWTIVIAALGVRPSRSNPL